MVILQKKKFYILLTGLKTVSASFYSTNAFPDGLKTD